MQLDKIRQTIRKIQALADNLEDQDQTSALERDLMLRYLRDLYEMVSETTVMDKIDVRPKSTEKAIPETAKAVEPMAEPPVAKVEIPEPDMSMPSDAEPDVAPETTTAETEAQPVHKEFSDTTKYFPPEEAKTPATATAPKETPDTQDAEVAVAESDTRFDVIFRPKNADDLMARLQSTRINRIEETLGLNERLLTINTLFGGDPNSFNDTLRALNEAGSFEQARQLLCNGAAAKYNWDATERLEEAKTFAQLVRRKFA